MAGDASSARIVKGQNYYLPAELARQVWRLACDYDDARRDVGGASESGLMVVAWELVLRMSVEATLEKLSRTATRRGLTLETDRKCYAIPVEMITRIEQRWRAVAMLADRKNISKPARSHLAELAQILLIELPPAERDALVSEFDVRKRRK